MSYEFAISRKKTVILCVCCILLVIMFFIAGLLSGMMINRSGPASVSGISTKVLKATSELQTEKVLEKKSSIVKDIKNQLKPEAVASEPEKTSAEPEKPAETGKDVAEEEKPGTESDTESGTNVAADTSEETEPVAPKQPVTLFSVEVASFVAQTRAMKMIADLKKKKYEPCIVKMWDSKNPDKIWYVVQIGDYGDVKKANEVANNFTETQGTVAIVRTMKASVLKERKVCAE